MNIKRDPVGLRRLLRSRLEANAYASSAIKRARRNASAETRVVKTGMGLGVPNTTRYSTGQ